MALAQDGRIEQALAALDAARANAVMPSPLWWPLRAELLWRAGRAAEALEEIQPALTEEQGIPSPLGYVRRVYAHVLQALGRQAEAVVAVGKADKRLDQQTPLDVLLPKLTYDDD